jgi:hypothetical protein
LALTCSTSRVGAANFCCGRFSNVGYRPGFPADTISRGGIFGGVFCRLSSLFCSRLEVPRLWFSFTVSMQPIRASKVSLPSLWICVDRLATERFPAGLTHRCATRIKDGITIQSMRAAIKVLFSASTQFSPTRDWWRSSGLPRPLSSRIRR